MNTTLLRSGQRSSCHNRYLGQYIGFQKGMPSKEVKDLADYVGIGKRSKVME